MKRKVLLTIILSFILLIASVAEVMAWGPITHFTLLDDIINDSRLKPEIKQILQENLPYAKGGVIGPDLFYFSDKRFADIAHYCSTNSLATSMLNNAKKGAKSQDLAFAYGWIIHVATDPVGHTWVNGEVKKLLPNLPPEDPGDYDPNYSAKKTAHKTIERSIDKLNFNTHSIM